ncbi:protein O-GlcNAcase [Anopheles arabiensis]|uniref:protein O-GlcNAcase n=3 Tax=gambiae species complex TaxID=44542 RepID=Q7QKE6_ANOGA|nr:protein O-GlcNAcase [Anopheles arabiensis]EAA03784.5 AGAP002287-PA [Anopheles gambiae str. PEST]
MAETVTDAPSEPAHPGMSLQEGTDAGMLGAAGTTNTIITSTTTTTDAELLPDGGNCHTPAEGFICGVVEGFYGRPWTTEQRKDLFRKLKQWGMDAYIYAPKDDYKHRAYWRELYTVEEADHLTGLIAAAHEQGINFYYALSPGLDITYSSAKEIGILKRKLDQVSQFGCKAFALLFDDIEPEMSKPDKEVFQSFAHAQVSVTNEIFNHLNCPRFLFCPTEYCSSRAAPTVKQSEYLNTLGSKLVRAIDILWTGPKVISKVLTVECIEEITEVLKRPPVIWDNLHANDYDQKRVFLGPYSGRSPELIPLLRGVVTNPNCEFHANSIAIQTLAFWSKCSADTKIASSLSPDIKLETENEQGICEGDAPAFLSENVYHPRLALKNAIANWLPEFYQEKEAWGPITKPQPAVTMVMPIIPIIPSVNTCMTLTSTSTTTTTTATALPMPEVNTTQLQLFADVCSTVTNVAETLPNPIMNSLVSATKVVTNESIPNPVVAAVNHIAIPPTIPLSSIPVPLLNMKPTESDGAEAVDCCREPANSVDMEKVNPNGSCRPEGDAAPLLDGDAVIRDESNEQRREDDGADGQRQTITEEEAKMLDLEENEVKMVDASEEPDDKMTVSDEQVAICQAPPALDKMVDDESDSKPDASGSVVPEPMECGSNLTSPKHQLKTHFDDIVMSETTSTCSGTMQVESSDTSLEMAEDKNGQEKQITAGDIMLLCDLFYLPFEHGSKALQLLSEFYWLRNNAYVLCAQRTNRGGKQRTTSTASAGGGVTPTTDGAAAAGQPSGEDITEASNGPATDGRDLSKCDAQEWLRRSESFQTLCQSIFLLTKKIANCANKEMCYDLFSYVWDIASVLSLLSAFVKWLALGNFPPTINSFTQGGYNWFSKGWKETFMSGDQEPWVFRGGLVADLQRLIPLDTGNDLFLYKTPETSAVRLYSIRPYMFSDEATLYDICHRTALDGEPMADRPAQSPLGQLIADRYLGPFLTLAPELCLVIEDHNGQTVGYACAALDAKVFVRNMEHCWIPEMCIKYPVSLAPAAEQPDGSTGGGSPEEIAGPNQAAGSRTSQMVRDSIHYFHSFQNDYPAAVLGKHPSLMCCRILKDHFMEDETVCKRVVTVLLAALRCHGTSFGVHVCISRSDRFLYQFYAKLGFVEIAGTEPDPNLYMGRSF